MLLTGCHIKAALLSNFNYTCFLIIYKELSECLFSFHTIAVRHLTYFTSHSPTSSAV